MNDCWSLICYSCIHLLYTTTEEKISTRKIFQGVDWVKPRVNILQLWYTSNLNSRGRWRGKKKKKKKKGKKISTRGVRRWKVECGMWWVAIGKRTTNGGFFTLQFASSSTSTSASPPSTLHHLYPLYPFLYVLVTFRHIIHTVT